MLTILQYTNTTSLIYKWGTFSPFLSLVILLLVLPNNFIVSRVKICRQYPIFIFNVILHSILFTYIFIEGFLMKDFSMFFSVYSKYSWIYDTEYDLSAD